MSSDVEGIIRKGDQAVRLGIMLGALTFFVIVVCVYVCFQKKKQANVIKHTHVSEKNVTVTHPASKDFKPGQVVAIVGNETINGSHVIKEVINKEQFTFEAEVKAGSGGDVGGKILTTAPSPKSGSTMGKRGVQVLPLDESNGGFDNKTQELTTPKDETTPSQDVTVDITPESNDNPPPPTAESEDTSPAGDQVVTVIQPQPAA